MSNETQQIEHNELDRLDAEADVLLDECNRMGEDEQEQALGKVLRRLWQLDLAIARALEEVRSDYDSVRTWLEQGESYLEAGHMPSDSSLRFNTHHALMAKGRHQRMQKERGFLLNLLDDLGWDDARDEIEARVQARLQEEE